jgi:hypothetical protein
MRKSKLILTVCVAACAVILLCSCDDAPEYKQTMREIAQEGKVYRQHAQEAKELIEAEPSYKPSALAVGR